ncbi:MAG: heparin lyase I family protein [Armatimonadota bacterium]
MRITAPRRLFLALLAAALAAIGTGAERERVAFWSADHETGDMSQWHDGKAKYPRGGVFNTGGELAEAEASTDFARSGKYSARMTIRGAAGRKLAVRLMRWGNEAWDTGESLGLPEEAYYSAWYYFPRAYRPAKWWNIFQFKSTPTGKTGQDSQPMWTVNVDSVDGEMTLYLYTKLNTPHNPGKQLVDPPLTLPVGKWVHLEVLYKHSETDGGRIAMWQDGTKIYDVDGVRTALGERITWGIGNYTDDIEPSTATIYVDDAVIATERIGPG